MDLFKGGESHSRRQIELDEARKPGGLASARAAFDLAQTLDRETELLRTDYISRSDLDRGLAGVHRTTQVIVRVLSDLTADTQGGSTGSP